MIKKKNEPEIIIQNSLEKLQRVRFREQDINYLYKIAEDICKDIPYEITYSNEDLDDNNTVYTYLAGLIKGLNGKCIKLSNDTYLYVSYDALLDGSIKNYVGKNFNHVL